MISTIKNTPRILRLLIWLRLADEHDGAISLTSLALIIALVKFAMVKDVSVPDLTAFFVAMGFYAYKRSKHGTTKAPSVDVSKAHADLLAAKDELRATESKMKLMMDTVAMGRR